MIPIGNVPPFGKGFNYATWNPADKGSDVTLSNGNLTASSATGGGTGNGLVRSTISKSTGKWYFEITAGTGADMIGIADGTAIYQAYPGYDTKGWGYYGVNGTKFHGATNFAFGVSYTTGDIIGVKLDADAGTAEMLKNNVSQGTITLTDLAAPYYAAFGSGINTADATANFGASGFTYAVPAGYNRGLYTP